MLPVHKSTNCLVHQSAAGGSGMGNWIWRAVLLHTGAADDEADAPAAVVAATAAADDDDLDATVVCVDSVDLASGLTCHAKAADVEPSGIILGVALGGRKALASFSSNCSRLDGASPPARLLACI